MSYEVVVERRARRAIARLPSTVYDRVLQAMATLQKIHSREGVDSSETGQDDASELGIAVSSTT